MTADAPAREAAAADPPPPKKQTILVVDDEADLVELIGMNLERNGYDVVVARDGPGALDRARKHRPDLIVLDLMLPGLDGTEVARRLKADAATQHVPIIMLTAKAEETDEVVGLAVGADDYMTKPFSMKVLAARVKAVLRRGSGGGEKSAVAATTGDDDDAGILRAGPMVMDTQKHDTSIDGRSLKLTLTEFKLLRALVEARGRVLSRDRLMDKAMGADVFVTDRAIDVHVTAIRKKLGDAAWLVHTVRGVGYRLQEEPEEA